MNVDKKIAISINENTTVIVLIKHKVCVVFGDVEDCAVV